MFVLDQITMSSETYGKQRSFRAYKPLLKKAAFFAFLLVCFLTIRSLLGGGGKSASRQVVPGDDIPPPARTVIRGRVFEPEQDEFDPGAAEDEAQGMDPDDAGQEDQEGGEQDTGCCTIYDLWQKNSDDFECSALDIEPGPLVCFYPHDDPSADVNSQWDGAILARIIQLLGEAGEGTGLIDVGSKLGVYSLSAAEEGYNVLSIEADIDNVKRFHKAVKLGRYESHITLLHNAISDSRNEVTPVKQQHWDQGDITPVKGIMLEDLPAFCKFRKAILKMDIEGYEHRAFRRASDLFREIQITYVFVNWETLKAAEHVDKLFVDEMIKYMSKRGYVPRSITGKVLSAAKWNQWPAGIYWHKM